MSPRPIARVPFERHGLGLIQVARVVRETAARVVLGTRRPRTSHRHPARPGALRGVRGALATNRAFLALAQPATNAQALAQVQALTRQNIALIRLVADLLDGTE